MPGNGEGIGVSRGRVSEIVTRKQCNGIGRNPHVGLASNDAQGAIRMGEALGAALPSPQPSPQGEGASNNPSTASCAVAWPMAPLGRSFRVGASPDPRAVMGQGVPQLIGPQVGPLAVEAVVPAWQHGARIDGG